MWKHSIAFLTERVLLSYTFYKWCRFYIPGGDSNRLLHIPSVELCIPFHCCKCTVFKINHKSNLFQSLKNASASPFGPFLQTEMTDFPTVSYTSAIVKSLPFHIPEEFLAEPPRIGPSNPRALKSWRCTAMPSKIENPLQGIFRSLIFLLFGYLLVDAILLLPVVIQLWEKAKKFTWDNFSF